MIRINFVAENSCCCCCCCCCPTALAGLGVHSVAAGAALAGLVNKGVAVTCPIGLADNDAPERTP